MNLPHRHSLLKGIEHLFSLESTSFDETKQEFDDRWVTVFGFPQVAMSSVMRQFQKYGDIIRYHVGNGNWVHIQFGILFSSHISDISQRFKLGKLSRRTESLLKTD